MPSVVVDDTTLLAVLTGRASAGLTETARAGEVSTTGTHAVLFLRLDDLPPEIVVPGPRLTVPVMGALRLTRRVNHLTAEALAVALVSNARIRVSTDAPLLRDACHELGIPLEVLSPFD